MAFNPFPAMPGFFKKVGSLIKNLASKFHRSPTQKSIKPLQSVGQCTGQPIKLPDVACVAFIPFSYRDMHRDKPPEAVSPLYHTAYRTNKYEQLLSPLLSKNKITRPIAKGRAFTRLFASGNDYAGTTDPSEPPDFANRRALAALSGDDQNFRASICLFGLTLYVDYDAHSLGLSGWYDNRAGATLVRPRVLDPDTLVQKPPRRWGGAESYTDPGAHNNPEIAQIGLDGYRITNRFWFRIGKLGQLMAWRMTGFWPPYCGVGIEYMVRMDWANQQVEVRVRFGGTDMPSHAYYANWVRHQVNSC
jgi:hypothetical protein